MKKTNSGSEQTIRFPSKKVKDIATVYCREGVTYAKKLDEDKLVAEYSTGIPLTGWREKVNLTGIRKSYQECEWTSDFVIRYTDTRIAVRELVKNDELTRRSAVEKLEISRRYWSALNVDWGIVIIDR